MTTVSCRAQRGPLELGGGPETKKARWSPSPATVNNANNNNNNGNGRPTDLFANYGYGNNHHPFNGSGAANGHSLYGAPSLTVNTSTNGMTHGLGHGLAHGHAMAPQMSPSSATSPFPPSQQSVQHQQAQQAQHMNGGAFGSGGMLNMGLPMGNMGMMSVGGMGGFPYSPQIGSFQQVRLCIAFPIVKYV